jgi:hypothetical protein
MSAGGRGHGCERRGQRVANPAVIQARHYVKVTASVGVRLAADKRFSGGSAPKQLLLLLLVAGGRFGGGRRAQAAHNEAQPCTALSGGGKRRMVRVLHFTFHVVFGDDHQRRKASATPRGKRQPLHTLSTRQQHSEGKAGSWYLYGSTSQAPAGISCAGKGEKGGRKQCGAAERAALTCFTG